MSPVSIIRLTTGPIIVSGAFIGFIIPDTMSKNAVIPTSGIPKSHQYLISNFSTNDWSEET